jgi:hypothetical protein
MLGDLEQVVGRARQPIETVDYDHILLAYLLKQADELRPVASGAGEC